MDTTTAPTRRRRSPRRLLLAAVAPLVALVGLAPGGAPAGAAPPGPVPILSALGIDQPGLNGIHRIDWAAPEGPAIDTVEIEQWDDGLSVKLATFTQDADEYEPTRFAGPYPDGVVFQYRIRAHGPDGWGPFGQFAPAQITSGRSHLQPYDDQVDFAVRQFDDFVGGPAGNELPFWAAGLDASEDVVDFIDHLGTRYERLRRPEVIRLYLASFDRAPEPAGLTYWEDQLEHGQTTLSKVSAFFVKSAEYQATYGNTTNQKFVTIVYLNVLDREPDAAGLAYWKGRLDQGTITRGNLMIGFSESAEGKAHVKGEATVADIWTTVLDEAPTHEQMATYGGHIDLGGTGGDIAVMLFATEAYPYPYPYP
ncbi:MAG TPA: DUF4214 domain-containing protein [Iamia sp.]|jgi:hypothetical protein|nr:DUF4214 domain-containing protein [Iamia sp.]